VGIYVTVEKEIVPSAWNNFTRLLLRHYKHEELNWCYCVFLVMS